MEQANVLNIIERFIDWTKNKMLHNFFKINVDLYFREKEIWWVAFGKNIGFETDGKHDLFERPAVILKKYSKDMCFILPLTSKVKMPLPWYQFVVEIEDKISAINVTQGRAISSRRLLRKKGILDVGTYDRLLDLFVRQFK